MHRSIKRGVVEISFVGNEAGRGEGYWGRDRLRNSDCYFVSIRVLELSTDETLKISTANLLEVHSH